MIDLTRAFAVALCLALAACGGEPEPCDTLCDEAGFSNVEETEDGCFCGSPGGFGSLLLLEDCQAYCDAVGQGEASLESAESDDDSCLCAAP